MFVMRALRSSTPLHARRRLLKIIAGVHMIRVCDKRISRHSFRRMVWYCSLVLLLAAFAGVRGQCSSNAGDPCSTDCNGVQVSIASAFSYP